VLETGDMSGFCSTLSDRLESASKKEVCIVIIGEKSPTVTAGIVRLCRFKNQPYLYLWHIGLPEAGGGTGWIFIDELVLPVIATN